MKKYHFESYVTGFMKSVGEMRGASVHFPHLLSFWEELLGVDDMRGVAYLQAPEHMAGVMVASSMYTHYTSGQQTFEVSEAMHEMLLRTDLQGITLADMILPYECLYISVPKGKYKLWGGPGSKYHECNGVYVRRRLYFELPRDVAIAIGEDQTPRIGDIRDIIPKLKTAGLSPEEVAKYQRQGFIIHAACLESEHSTSWGDDCHTWVSLSLADWEDPKYATDRDNDVESFMKSKIFHEMMNCETNQLEFLSSEEQKRHAEQFFNLAKVAINTIVYLNHGLETKTTQRRDNKKLKHFQELYKNATSGSKLRTYGRQVTKACKPTVHLIGPGVQEMRAPLPNDILVRGHWHTYWVGKGRAKRQLNWVQPYLRNKTVDGDVSV